MPEDFDTLKAQKDRIVREQRAAILAPALSIARRAVNGWACYAKRDIEHREIAALHLEIDDLQAHRVADSACCSPASAATPDGHATDRPSSGASLGRGLDPEGEKAYERIHDTSPTQERVTVEEVTAGLGAEVVSPPGERLNGDAILRHMVNRFLAWRLPENFNPDGGISFTRDFNEHTPYPMKHEPTGTNLFTATQAEAMVRHLLGGDPDGATTARSRPIPLPDPLAPEGERRPPTESEKL